MHKSAKQHQFTLIEVLMAMAILSILMGLGVVTYHAVSNNPAPTKALLGQLQRALMSYQIKHGYYPQQTNDIDGATPGQFVLDLTDNSAPPDSPRHPKNNLTDCITNYELIRKRSEENSDGYIVVLDSFGNPVYYQAPGKHNRTSFDLLSYGPDGQGGTEDDIKNW